MASSDIIQLESSDNVFAYTSGPPKAKILIVGEAWGSEEAQAKRPFAGYSGQELDRMLHDAGLNRRDILVSNLIDKRPPGNDFTHFLNPTTPKKATFRGTSITPELERGYRKLHNLIQRVEPELIIGAGNWPLWALTSHAKMGGTKGYQLPGGIMKHRGSQTYTEPINGREYPYLPIIHPAAITRNWSDRHITVHDLRVRAKAFERSAFDPAVWRGPEYPTLASGTFKESYNWWRERAKRASRGDQIELCVDVETWRRAWLCVVGACDGQSAIVTPFFHFNSAGEMIDNFTQAEERIIVHLIRLVLSHPNVSIVNQNYSYDYQFLAKFLKIYKEPTFDTMLAHHVMWPGTEKDLSRLASLYCEHYKYWKDESQDWEGKGDPREFWFYNGKDTWKTFEIVQRQKLHLKKLGMEELFEFQMEQWRLYNEVGQRGANWDYKRADVFRQDLQVAAKQLQQWLLSCMPEDIRYAPSGKPWYDSPKHQQYIFYDRLKIKEVIHKKTKKPTTDKESLETLKRRAPWLSTVFDQMKLLRSVNVFERNFLDIKLSPQKRLRSAFNVGGTESLRLSSSSNPFGEGMNLQNLPKVED